MRLRQTIFAVLATLVAVACMAVPGDSQPAASEPGPLIYAPGTTLPTLLTDSPMPQTFGDLGSWVTVVVRLDIDAGGKVVGAKVLLTSDSYYSPALIQALLKRTYIPARQAGRAIPISIDENIVLWRRPYPEVFPPAPPGRPKDHAGPWIRSDCEAGGQYASIRRCDSGYPRAEDWFTYFEACRRLGADLQLDCKSASSPILLEYAARTRDLERMDWLISHGLRARPREQSWGSVSGCGMAPDPTTPERCEELVKRLLSVGWDLNSREGLAMLIGASPVMIELAVKYGADLQRGGDECRSVLDMAEQWGRPESAAELRRQGAMPRNPISKAACVLREIHLPVH